MSDLTGTTGGEIDVLGGAGGSLTIYLTGFVGGIVQVVAGKTPGVALEDDGRLLRLLISGVERTEYLKADGGDSKGPSRTLAISGGSKATCTFVLTQKGTPYRPLQGEEVILWSRGKVWYAGLVDFTGEYDYTGSAERSEITVNCADYGALLDRIVIGREYLAYQGNLASILFNQLSEDYFFPRLGISYVFTWDPMVALGDQVFNWVSGTQALNAICAGAGGDWRVDFSRNLYLFPSDEGYAAAPFTITDDDGNWRDMTVTRDSSKYRNRIGVRNSANTNPIWTDTFAGSDGPIFQTMSPLQSKPIVRVNGVPATVIDFADLGTLPYDYYWLQPNSVVRNLAAAFDDSDVVTISYPSVLSYVAWAQDDAEIALYGMFEGIEEVHDVPTVEALDAIAVALLARRKVRPMSVVINTDRDGLEPGMALTVNTSRPLVNDTLLITQVTSTEVGKKFFRHQVRAVNSANLAISENTAFIQSLLARTAQPKDRVRQNMRFTLAETIEGIENPGLTTGLKNAVVAAPDSGYMAQCTLFFQSSATVATTSEIVIDVLQNGVSIFGATKMVWPIGATALQTQIQFAAMPLPIEKGDLFQMQVLSADSAAQDGVLSLEMLVR